MYMLYVRMYICKKSVRQHNVMINNFMQLSWMYYIVWILFFIQRNFLDNNL